MVRRVGKKKNRKRLGSRTHGGGNAKNRRGKGCKGGWGRAGMHKHRWSYITAHERDAFGVHGFYCPTSVEIKKINLWEIDQKARKNEIPQKEGKYYFEFDGKVLGCGELTLPVIVKARSASKNAIEKLKKSGGAFEVRV